MYTRIEQPSPLSVFEGFLEENPDFRDLEQTKRIISDLECNPERLYSLWLRSAYSTIDMIIEFTQIPDSYWIKVFMEAFAKHTSRELTTIQRQ